MRLSPTSFVVATLFVVTIGVPARADEVTDWNQIMPQPAMLARFLADRNQKIPEAVSLARKAAVDRHDIFTEDALSWALFKAGSISEARAVSALALRTGTRDRAVLKHAAAIKAGTLR